MRSCYKSGTSLDFFTFVAFGLVGYLTSSCSYSTTGADSTAIDVFLTLGALGFLTNSVGSILNLNKKIVY